MFLAKILGTLAAIWFVVGAVCASYPKQVRSHLTTGGLWLLCGGLICYLWVL
jgi:hypothetical protein